MGPTGHRRHRARGHVWSGLAEASPRLPRTSEYVAEYVRGSGAVDKSSTARWRMILLRCAHRRQPSTAPLSHSPVVCLTTQPIATVNRRTDRLHCCRRRLTSIRTEQSRGEMMHAEANSLLAVCARFGGLIRPQRVRLDQRGTTGQCFHGGQQRSVQCRSLSAALGVRRASSRSSMAAVIG